MTAITSAHEHSLPVDNVSGFLSHSSKVKSFVRAVAKRLGRVQVFLDEWNLQTGDEFAKVIPEALQKRQVFVLFASRASLDSLWVKFETKEARELSVRSDPICSGLYHRPDS